MAARPPPWRAGRSGVAAVARAALLALAAAGGLALAACTAPPPSPPPPAAEAPLVAQAPFAQVAAAARVVGDWRWTHDSIADGARRREREHWQLARDGLTRLRGSYLREVDVELIADDGAVFACNQRRSYRQVARFDVTGVVTPDGVQLDEVGYQAAPSPCDPGLRQLTGYQARVDHAAHLVLVGAHTVARLHGGDGSPPPPLPAPPTSLTGAWTWSAVSWTGDGLVQREAERWQLDVRGDDVTGSYQRVVSLARPDGAVMPCAGADRYQFVDRYQLVGKATADGWRLREDEVDAGVHPCLAGTPTRSLDEATAVLDGDYLILTWRGPRRQVLARPTPVADDRPW